MTKLPTLFTRTSTGATQEWTIEILNNAYRTHHGQVGGKITITDWFYAYETNVGRTNYRDVEAQAIFEAQAQWKKKLDSGSFEDINAIDEQKFVSPMLAKNWNDRKDKVKFPVYCNVKYDGSRSVISRNGAFSRNGKPWLTIPHILEELEIVFREIPDLILDGELYNHDLHNDFNKIMSLIKKTKPTQADLIEAREVVQYHCYDICDDKMVYSDRAARIVGIIKRYNLKYVIPVVAYKANNQEELDTLYGQFLEDGYEGQMIRLNTPYDFKRSANLLKRKEFMDSEYLVVDILEGNGNRNGIAGYAQLQREDGVQFKSNIKGNHTYLRELLATKDRYIGKYATCKYFALSIPQGIPRFPYIIKFRDGVSQD